MARVIVTGDRAWPFYWTVWRRLRRLAPGTVIVHGAAPGADTCAHWAAQALGLVPVPYFADWHRHGRAAGPIRNAAMVHDGAALGLAFHGDLKSSRGTRDCVRRMELAGITVERISR